MSRGQGSGIREQGSEVRGQRAAVQGFASLLLVLSISNFKSQIL
jgi:hypothetical protein